MTVQPPKKFVNLHGHTTFSQGDGIGTPGDHIDFAVGNGADALAITDHGNCNAFAGQWFHSQGLKKKGVDFKPVHGVEAYFVESLSDWKNLYQNDRERKAAEAAAKKVAAIKGKAKALLVGDPAAPTQLDLIEDQAIVEVSAETKGEGEESGLVENETESKAGRWKNPLMKRSHLVLLAKNNQGLKDLFALVSESFVGGFYRYPRIDYDLLKKHCKGNIIGLQACVGGYLAGKVFDFQENPDFNTWEPTQERFEEIQAVLATDLEKFQDCFGKENYYLELQWNKLGAQHLVNQHFCELSRRTGTPMVVTADSHYPNPDHWREREIYRMMARQQIWKEQVSQDDLPRSIDDLKCELYPKNADQMWESFQRYSQPYPGVYDDVVVKEAIERTWEIAHHQIDTVTLDTNPKLPRLSKIASNLTPEQDVSPSADPDDIIAFRLLLKQALSGLIDFRKLGEKPEYVARLRHELEVVKHLKLSRYFLTYSKIQEIISQEMLLGAGRGSAAGSLLCFVLNITQVDPIKYGLLFERFLVRNKKGFPDIDSDYSDRERAVKLVTDYFGPENVVPVSNFNNLQLRSLIKDLGRLTGLEFMKINEVTSKVEAESRAAAKREPGFDAGVWELTFEEAQENSPTFEKFLEDHPDLEKTIKVLFKQQRSLSRHAGGVVITDNAYANMPCIRSKDVIQTPWTEGLNNRHLEPLGFLKFDILGLGTLRVFEGCIRKILKKEGNRNPTFSQVKAWYDTHLDPSVNNYDDQHVYQHIFWEKRFAGVFQFVRDNVQNFISEMKPTSIKDLATCTSIFRPGPLGLKADQLFLENRRDPDRIHYQHPVMEEVLGETSGLMIFQEQLQLLVHKMAGWDLEDTDPIRKNFTKKEIAGREKQLKEREELKRRFLEGCLATSNLSATEATKVWELFEKWTAYGFNAAHAVSYCICTYICAWFLTYYPDEWVSAYLDYCSSEKGKVTGGEDPKAVALGEIKALGYEVGHPDLNLSEVEAYVQPGTKTVIPSFLSMKHVGKTVYQELNRFRPYHSLEDLLLDPVTGAWRHSKFNKRALATLVKLEAMESLGLIGPGRVFQNYKQLHHVVVDKADDLKRASARKRAPSARDLLLTYTQEAQDIPDWTNAEKVQFQLDLVGTVDMSLVVPPEALHLFQSNNVKTLDEWTDEDDQCWAVVKTSVVATTKTGKQYLKVRVTTILGQQHTIFAWSYNPLKDRNPPKENDIVMGRFKKSEFGWSTFVGQLHVVRTKD